MWALAGHSYRSKNAGYVNDSDFKTPTGNYLLAPSQPDAVQIPMKRVIIK